MFTIGLDYTAAIHQSAGIGRYTRELVTALAGLTPEAFPARYCLFVAAAGRDHNNPLPGPNFGWYPTRLSERWLARLWFRLRLPLRVELWTGGLDLFHAPDFFLPPVQPGTRTIVTVHDLSFIREPQTVMPGMARPLRTRVPRAVARADHVIAVSEATKRDLIELYQTPADKISTLYHGVSAAFRPVTDPAGLAAVRRKYGLGEAPFVLSVGTIQPRKNYRRLIQAFGQIETAHHLVIAGGKGWDYETILAEVSRQNLEGRVHLPGYVAEADLPALYSAAGLFVYPSLYEGFGLPVLEAMACGTAVITSDVSAMPEVVGRAGLLVDPHDSHSLAAAMAGVLADSTLRQRLSRAGRVQAQKFRWQETATQLVKLYQTIIEEK